MNNSLIIKKDTKSENTLQIFKTIIFNQEMVLLLSILFLLIVVGFINPRYVSNRNLISLFLGNAYIAVAAIGMSMVIISGNIDISVGSLIGVLATISGTIAEAGFPIWISWTIPLAIGMFINFVIGILVLTDIVQTRYQKKIMSNNMM